MPRWPPATVMARALPTWKADGVSGRLVAGELEVLQRLTESPDRPYTVVLGGSKVSDKLGVIAHLIERVDTLLIGGVAALVILGGGGLWLATQRSEPATPAAVVGEAGHADSRRR